MEYRKICNVCGHIYCYTDADISANKTNSLIAGLSALSTIANAVGGTMYGAYESDKMADRAQRKIVDYNKCPNCGSSDVRDLTEKEFKDSKDRINSKTVGSAISINTNASVDSLIQRGMLFLEEADWSTANVYFENALDADPTNIYAYVGKLMIDLRLKTVEELADYKVPIDDNPNYKKALRFAGEGEKEKIQSISKQIQNNISLEEKNKEYKDAEVLLKSGTLPDIKTALNVFRGLENFKDSKEKESQCLEKMYQIAVELLETASVDESGLEAISTSKNVFSSLDDYKDSQQLVIKSEEKYRFIENEYRKLQEEARIQAINAAEDAKKKKKKSILVATGIFATLAVLSVIFYFVILPIIHVKKGDQLVSEGLYDDAIAEYEAVNNTEKVLETKYKKAVHLADEGSVLEAIVVLQELGDYQDSKELIDKCLSNTKDLSFHGTTFKIQDNWFYENVDENQMYICFQNEKPDKIYDLIAITYNKGFLSDTKKYDDAVNCLIQSKPKFEEFIDPALVESRYDKDETPVLRYTGSIGDGFYSDYYIMMSNYNDILFIQYIHYPSSEMDAEYNAKLTKLLIDNMEFSFEGFEK